MNSQSLRQWPWRHVVKGACVKLIDYPQGASLAEWIIKGRMTEHADMVQPHTEVSLLPGVSRLF
jgi:hypothetical protein